MKRFANIVGSRNINIGFTGTRSGMSDSQKSDLREVFKSYRGDFICFHHGDCIGSDAQAHDIALEYKATIIIHPPLDGTYRAFCIGEEVRAAEDYLKRNHSIVNETELLVAAPKTIQEELRSGTWATIRYAIKCGKDVRLLRR